MMSARVARAFALSLLSVLLCALLFSACTDDDAKRPLPPIGQVLLYIDTDAPLPRGSGESARPEDVPALFDRIRIDVFRPDEASPCADCTHEFDVDRTIVGSGRASIGITTPPHVGGHRVRARLYSARFLEGDEPRPDGTIDVTVVLPATDDEGITPVTVFLPTDNVARPVGSLDEPSSPELGAPAGRRVGTWPGARRIPCPSGDESEAAPSEVCVPGGAFWMGQPLLRGRFFELDPPVLHLVVVSPFYIDLHEVLVEEFREARIAQLDTPLTEDPLRAKPSELVLRCTYTNAPGDNEKLPVNCISWERARAYCLARGAGADLPTEAQHQFVASAREGRLYPWGDETPTCKDAVFGSAPILIDPEDRCPGGWLNPPGSAARDRLAIDGREIVDLAGNVSEYARDYFNFGDEPCWGTGGGTGVIQDPLCTTSSKAPSVRGLHTIVRGGYTAGAFSLTAAFRQPTYDFNFTKAVALRGRDDAAGVLAGTGFRCAHSTRRD